MWEFVEQLHAPQLLKEYHSCHPLMHIKTLLIQCQNHSIPSLSSLTQSWSSIPMPTLTTASPHPSHIPLTRLCLTSLSTHPMSPPLPHHLNHPYCPSCSILSPLQPSLLTPCSHLRWQSMSLPVNLISTRPFEPSPMDLSQPSTTGRSSMLVLWQLELVTFRKQT